MTETQEAAPEQPASTDIANPAEQQLAVTKGTLPEAVVRRGIPEGKWRMLFNLFPGARPEMALMVWDYCQARGLDPMKKPCHIVSMRVKVNGQWTDRDVVMPGIYEYRITAHRTGTYLGHSRAAYGPVTNYPGDGAPKGYAGVDAPEWCEMTFYRQHGDRVIEFPVTVFFSEVVATNRDGQVNDRWTRAPRQMLTKCTEAAGLREGWPEEFGGEATAEELEGQREDRLTTAPPAPLARRSASIDVTDLRPAHGVGQLPQFSVREADAAADVTEVFGPDDGRPAAAPAPSAATAAPSPRPQAAARREYPEPKAQSPAPAAAAPRKAAAAPPPSTPQTTSNALVHETNYVTPKGAEPFWDINVMYTREGGGPQVGAVYITRDEALYKQAVSCEGTGALLTLTWHHSKRTDGSPCKVLDAIAAAD